MSKPVSNQGQSIAPESRFGPTEPSESEPAVLPHGKSLAEFLAELDGNKKVPLINTSLLLLPIERVFSLLDYSWAELWQSARLGKPGLPDRKTMTKVMANRGEVTVGTLLKIERAAPNRHLFHKRLLQFTEEDYSWPTGIQWTSLIDGGLFNAAKCSAFWNEFVKQAADLHGKTLYREKSRHDYFAAYNCNYLVERFGCVAARNILKQRIDELGPAAENSTFETDPALIKATTADSLCVLLRLAAWLVADLYIQHWDSVEREGMVGIVHLEWAIPSLSVETGQWSCPLEIALKKLADRAGCPEKLKVSTSLGKLWAKSDNAADATSRMRSIRDWQQQKNGRPRFESFYGLSKAVLDAEAERTGNHDDDRDYGYWLYAVFLRFAETLGIVRAALSKAEWSNELITSVMNVYGSEYRTALAELGKPIPCT